MKLLTIEEFFNLKLWFQNINILELTYKSYGDNYRVITHNNRNLYTKIKIDRAIWISENKPTSTRNYCIKSLLLMISINNVFVNLKTISICHGIILPES